MSLGVVTLEVEKDSFDEYVQAGGMLSREEFQESLSALKNSRYPTHHPPTWMQAQSLLKSLTRMGAQSSPELMAALGHLYIVLRTKRSPPCATQSDQKLFFQALLILRCYEAARLFEERNIFSRA